MTIAEFRTDPQLPFTWRKELRENPILKLVLEVMEDNHPARFSVDGDNNGDVSPTQAAIQLGETRGYSKYSNGLKLLATPRAPVRDPGEPTYSDPRQPMEEIQHA